MRLLIVEDHADTASAYSHMLVRLGHTVHVAHNVHSALICCTRNEYDVLLLDIGLPDGTGWELMKELLGRSPMRAIAVTGYGYDADIRKSKEAGFDAHLIKPVLIESLLAAIKEVSELPPRDKAVLEQGD